MNEIQAGQPETSLQTTEFVEAHCPTFIDSDIPSTMSMHLQTATKLTARRYVAEPPHFLLTFFNETTWEFLTCQRAAVDLHSPGNTGLLTLNDNHWNEIPDSLLAVDSGTDRGTKICPHP